MKVISTQYRVNHCNHLVITPHHSLLHMLLHVGRMLLSIKVMKPCLSVWLTKRVFALADVGYCPVKLGMMSNRLQSGVNTLQGFREDRRNQVTLGTVLLRVYVSARRQCHRISSPTSGSVEFS